MKCKAQNEVSITLPSLSANEGTARSFAGIFLSQMNPTVEELADVKCAVSEAVTNCIVHAYKNTLGEIHMTMKQLPDRVFRVEIRDRGVGIPDISAAMEPLFTTDPEDERSGMGFSIMESFGHALGSVDAGQGNKTCYDETPVADQTQDTSRSGCARRCTGVSDAGVMS